MDDTFILQCLFEDDDEEMLLVLTSVNELVSVVATNLCVMPRESVPRILGFVEETVPRFSNRDFRQHFRLDRTKFPMK